MRESLAAWQLRVPQIRADWDRPRALVRAVGLRPRVAADARRRAARPHARRGDAVVHDRLRARHDDHVSADAALRPRARAHGAGGARRAAGDARTTPTSTPSRARSSTSCARQGRAELVRAYYGTVDATPLYLVLLSEVWRWTDDAAFVRGLREPALRGARLDRRVRRPGRRRLRRVRAADAARARESVVEGLRRLAALPRRSHRRGADRAGRGAGLRLRREAADGRARARRLARPRARRAARARGRGAAASASTSSSGSRRAAATTRSRSTARSGRSTRSAPTSGTCSGAGSSRRSAWTPSSTR